MKRTLFILIIVWSAVACSSKDQGFKPDTTLLPGEWILSASSDHSGTATLPNVSYIFKNDIVFFEKFDETLQYGTWSVSKDTILHLQYTNGVNNHMNIKVLTSATMVVESEMGDGISRFTFSRKQPTSTPK